MKKFFWVNLLYRVAFSVLRGLQRLPWRWQRFLGRKFGKLLFYLLKKRRHIADINLRLAFPHLPPQEHHALLQAHFEAVGIGVFELANAWWSTPSHLPPVSVEGLEHWHHAQKLGKGVILLGLHMTNQELVGRLLQNFLPCGVTYRPHENPFLDQMFLVNRQRIYRSTFPRDALLAMVRQLRQGEAIWYAPDQSLRGKQSVLAPFFGIPTPTNIALGRLAILANALIIPCAGIRLRDGSYRILLKPPQSIENLNDEALARYLNQIFETFIREAPEQYFWIHRKWKHHPTGNPYVNADALQRIQQTRAQ